MRPGRAPARCRKAGYPTIEVTGSYARSFYEVNGPPERPPNSPLAIGINLRIPIFTGFRQTYAARQAQAVADQAEASRDQLYRQSQLEVWQAYYDLQTVTSGIGSTEAQVKFAEQTAQATLARYQAGFGTILDLITAQQDETNARTQRIQSYLDWYTVLARLNLALGASDLISTGSEKKNEATVDDCDIRPARCRGRRRLLVLAEAGAEAGKGEAKAEGKGKGKGKRGGGPVQ